MDTAFALTSEFDRWSDNDVRFIFGFNAIKKAVAWAESGPEQMYHELFEPPRSSGTSSASAGTRT